MTYRRLYKRRRPMPDAEYNQRLEAFRVPVPHDPRWWKMYGHKSEMEWSERKSALLHLFGCFDGANAENRYVWNYRGDMPPMAPSLDEFRNSRGAGEFLLAGD